jgi:hypothetical protein
MRVQVRASEKAIRFIRRRGGSVYAWRDGPLPAPATYHYTTRPPAPESAFTRWEQDGFCFFFPPPKGWAEPPDEWTWDIGIARWPWPHLVGDLTVSQEGGRFAHRPSAARISTKVNDLRLRGALGRLDRLALPIYLLLALIWIPLYVLIFAVATAGALVFDYTIGLVARPLGLTFPPPRGSVNRARSLTLSEAVRRRWPPQQ